MTEGIMDDLFYIKKSAFKNHWKKELTVTSETEYSNKVYTMELWYDCGDSICIPRYYLNNIKIIEDRRVTPKYSFPEFKLSLYPEQQEACNEILDYFKTNTGGHLISKPGTGKTIMALYIAQKLGLKTLVLLGKSDLMEQWKERIKQCFGDIPIGIIRQKKQKIEGITIATFQTIFSQKIDLKNEFGLVIVEECHHVPAFTFVNVIRNQNAKYFLGITATPERSDRLEKVMFWHLGPIITVCKRKNLTGKFFQLRYKSPLLKDWKVINYVYDNLQRIVNVLVKDRTRNQWIIETAKKGLSIGRKVIILSGRVKHCKIISSNIPDSALYLGNMKKEELEESKKKRCIVGTWSMFAEGTDVPDLDTLIMATPIGSISQAVGRIQRHFSGKFEPYVIDIFDEGLPLLEGLAWKRRRILKREGFKEIK